MDMMSNIGLGLATALTPTNLIYCFLGVFLGTLVGVLPGIGALAAMSMLFPITFYLDPTTALIMLGGIYYGTAYGGSTASILLNLPGSTSSAVTCIDGYPMAQQGRGGVALLMTALASFIGGSIGILLLMLFAPIIATYALRIGSAEYFSMVVLGLVAASTISSGSALKSLSMVVVGIMFGCVGIDIYTGTMRFSFGFFELADGINLVALAMGIFGVAEVIATVGKVTSVRMNRESLKFSALRPTRDDVRRSVFPVARGSLIGSFFGALPGTGPAIAAFMSYAVEKRVAKEPQRFGKGAIEGVVSPEAANNAADQTSFIPTLSLGIPGSATMALILGVLMIHGVVPGPTLMRDNPDIFWGLVMSFWVGNLMLLVLNIPMVGLWVRLLQIPYHLLFPSILMFICVGAYAVNLSTFDVWFVVIFGLLGYVMRIFDWPSAPLLLGFVLGPMMEEHFRRAMLLSHGDFATFFNRPISATIMAMMALLLLWAVWSELRRKGAIIEQIEAEVGDSRTNS
jgi:TctA family transporter